MTEAANNLVTAFAWGFLVGGLLMATTAVEAGHIGMVAFAMFLLNMALRLAERKWRVEVDPDG